MTSANAPSTLTGVARLYRSKVMHQRVDRLGYRFVYQIFTLTLDIDRLQQQARTCRWLSIDRFNLVSLYRADHGERNGQDLRPWVEQQLRRVGINQQPARIELNAIPRLLGYGFNPLSVFYCYDDNGQIMAAVLEVKNTFGDQHPYVVSNIETLQPRQHPVLTGEADKQFYVSPFIAVEGRYRFRLTPPAERMSIEIHLSQQQQPLLVATQHGQARPLSDGDLLRQVLRMPWMSVKVIAGIHWHALKLWLRGARFYAHADHPAPEQAPSKEETHQWSTNKP